MRVASSGAHDVVAEGGASALGSVASFGWIAPQAANRPAQPATDALRCVMRVDFDQREAMDQTGTCPDERQPCQVREQRRSCTMGLTARSAHSYSRAELVRAMDGDRSKDRVGVVSAPALLCDRCSGNRAGRRPARLVYLADAGCRRKMRPMSGLISRAALADCRTLSASTFRPGIPGEDNPAIRLAFAGVPARHAAVRGLSWSRRP
jgi:hypothetical protein